MELSLIARISNLSSKRETIKAKVKAYPIHIQSHTLSKAFFSGRKINLCQKIVLNRKSLYISIFSFSFVWFPPASRCFIPLLYDVRTFKPDKNIKLATYASRCIENEILMYLRKCSAQKTEVSIDEPLNTDWDGNELLLSDILGTDADAVSRPLEDDAERAMLLRAIETLGERDRQIILLRFGIGGAREATQKEVADLLGISQSYISRLEKRIIAHLRQEMLKQMQC